MKIDAHPDEGPCPLAHTCETCRKATPYDELVRRPEAVADCCFQSLVHHAAHTNAVIGLVVLHRRRDGMRKVMDGVADRLATHPDPRMREAAQKYRNLRHAPDDPNAPPATVPDGVTS